MLIRVLCDVTGLEQASTDPDLIDERPSWVCEADRYASWYEDVESIIVLLLECVNIKIDPGRTSLLTHRFHENVLKQLQSQINFYHDALGSGKVIETLWQSKNFRNSWRNKGDQKGRLACLQYVESIPSQKRIVEAGLLAAFRILGTRVPVGSATMQQIHVRRQQLDKGKEDLEREKKAFNESCALRKEEADKCLADQEKTSQGIMARDRATLEQEREAFDERVRNITVDLDKRSAKIDEEKSSHQRALQAHQESELDDWGWLWSVRAFDSAELFESQSRIEENLVMELQEMLDIKTAELKRLQDKEATRKDDPDIHEELCAILYRHRRSQNPQELPIVIGEWTEDGSENLAGMLRDLLTNHARGVNEIKVAKDRQRQLQEENELLEQRLANAEAQNSTDRLVVESALSRMEANVDSGVKILKSFFTKQEIHRESGGQKDSSTSK